MVFGYLVVLREAEFPRTDESRRYKGIDRVPGQPTSFGAKPGEDAAMEAYVFDKRFVDYDSGLIRTLSSARELLRMFARSERKFEIIFVRTVDCTDIPAFTAEAREYSFLGYDVAGMAPAGSVVLDWDSTIPRSEFPLNPRGLFATCEEAAQFREAGGQAAVDEHGQQHIWEIYAVGGVD